MPTLLLAFGLLSYFNTSAHADPLVKFPEGNAAWIVEITYPKPSQSNTLAPSSPQQKPVNTRKPQKIEVTQADNVRRIRITWDSGAPTEQWSIPNLPVTFKEYPDGSVFTVLKGSIQYQTDNFNLACDAPAFAWITPKDIVGKDPVTYEGKKCYHYAGANGIVLNIPHYKPAMEKHEAWIDIKTSLPVALNTETSHSVFTFLPAPDGPLEMSEKFKKEIAYYKHVAGYP
ncbi:MAG: hypothetical protein PHD76_13005 [Methylacidiphilales bacterium]|nr:hypothetical protein [Candidatus Methylacidiphilales bacterium]